MASSAPKILLAKPGLVTSAKFGRGGGGGGGAGEDDAAASLRSRLPPNGSLNLLSDSWEFHTDRFLSFLTDNTEFMVVGVIGTTGVGKSTILNEIYGFDPSSNVGMLPPFAIQSEETRAMAKHCTIGIEPRVSTERIILLDTQPVFSPSVLAEMIRPDGSSTVSVISGESLSAELAHELTSIQLGVLLASICHVILVVSEGVHDASMWRLMLTVDLLKHGIPDPSSVSFKHSQSSNSTTEKEKVEKITESGLDYMATPVFVHSKICDQELCPANCEQMKKAVAQYFRSSSFLKAQNKIISTENNTGTTNLYIQSDEPEPASPKLFLLPSKGKDDVLRPQYESYTLMLSRLRDQVLSMDGPSFSRTVSERDWLKNSAKIWDIVKNSPIIADYCKTLRSSGLFRR
ncbi:hypothetical protein LIER_10210 [Lithospermum erythrorhizon]|uniref:Protein SMG9 n=1 Tax=Lithospermum erythrorhizon TaxID=34254 RepID=A0AAV3PKS0_LITER